jgi:two-component system sensor histidine kinase CiaH
MRRFLRSSTARLAVTYLGLIMVLSIGFSVALYKTSSHAIDRQLPPNSLFINDFGQMPGHFDNFFVNRIAQGKQEIFDHLLVLNILALLIGAGLSYFLARKTLEPIENAMEEQSRFSSDASHELRTPLTAIRATNEVALRKPNMKISEAKAVIESNLKEVKKLEKLSEALLRLSHSDGKDLIKSKISLDEAVNEAMNQFITIAQAKKISIEDNIPKINVLGDQSGITRVICVLLDNAIKYGKEKDIIYLEGQQKSGYGYLTIRDTGPGMRASDLPHIFDRFYRADNSRSRSDGNDGYGLGLSIAKQIMDHHGGDISVTSKLGEGTAFTIKLPISHA